MYLLFEFSLTARKWFLAEIGHVGLNNLLAAYIDKSADAICTFAYSAGPGAEVELFEGICVVNPLGSEWLIIGRYCACSRSYSFWMGPYIPTKGLGEDIC